MVDDVGYVVYIDIVGGDVGCYEDIVFVGFECCYGVFVLVLVYVVVDIVYVEVVVVEFVD